MHRNVATARVNPAALLLHWVFVLVFSTSPAWSKPPGTIETVAGTGKPADGADAGAASETNVGNPFGVELGPDRALYICEVENHRVRRLDLKTGMLTTVAGCAERGYAGDGGPARKAKLNEPYEVRFDSAGNMYFVEMKNHLVRRVDAESGIISTVAGTGKQGYGGDGGPAVKASFSHPHSIALDDEYLYVADIGNHRIRRVDLERETITTIAGNGKKQLPADGQTAAGKPLLGPRALYRDGSTLWIALREGHSVWKLDLASGKLQHVAGTGKKGYSGDGGPAKKAQFNGPKGIALGPHANVFVVDTENQAIRMIDLARDRVTTVAGSGTRGYGGDGGPATAAKLNRPHGICIAPDGSLFVGDSENHRVRRVWR